MRASHVAVMCVFIVVLLGMAQLNMNMKNSWADWMIDLPHSDNSPVSQNNRKLIQIKENDMISSVKTSFENGNFESAENAKSDIELTKLVDATKSEGSEAVAIEQLTANATNLESGADASLKSEVDGQISSSQVIKEVAESSDSETKQAPVENSTIRIAEEIPGSELNRTNSSAFTGSIRNESLSVSNKTLRFHLIMTRFVAGTSILNFNRPPSIYYAMYNYRQRRVLESIFYHHPKADVTIHTNFMNDSDFAEFIGAGYNLRTMRLRFEELAAGTPLEGATRDPKWKEWETGTNWYTCFSDLYRLIVMWTLGGVYMDTDMVITKPFDGLDKAVGFQDKQHAFLNCAMIIFKEPGSPFIWKCMEEVAAHYNGVVWGANGPMLLTRVWRGWRSRKERSRVIQVQDQPKFYMFYHRDAKHHCFNNSMTGEQRLAYAKTLAARVPYAVHMSNKMTWLVKKDLIPGTFCHYLFTRYCIFCDAYPPKPPSYPAIDEGGEHVELP